MIFFKGRVESLCADITKLKCDGIVNAANSSLMGGGGVDGAIHRAAGGTLLEACKLIRGTTHPRGLPPGEAVVTQAGNLPCRRVIHTVGPQWQGGGNQEAETLARCYRNSLALACSEGLKTLAFPAISTGVYGYPGNLAASVVYRVLEEELANHNLPEKVLLVFFSPGDEKRFTNSFQKAFSLPE